MYFPIIWGQKTSGMWLFFFSSWWDKSDEDLKKVYHVGLGLYKLFQEAELNEENL